MYLGRGLVVWLVIILAESIHGTLRQIFLAPLAGDFQARRIAVLSGILSIFLIALGSIRWIGARSVGSLLLTGLLWTILTVAFEIGLGVLVFGYSGERILEDYDISRGGFMSFGLLFMTFSPLLAAKMREMARSSEKRVK